jgi:hypothetical protein
MPHFSKSTGARIRGTLETVSATYQITSDPQTGAWTYSGEQSIVFDEGAEIDKDDAGEFLFLTVDGHQVPESDLAWREEGSA